MAYFFLLIIIYAMHTSVQFKIHVTECPGTAGKWKARSLSFVCGGVGEEYHCLQDVNETLIETCMIPFHIKANKGGCPWIHIKDNGSPIVGYPMHNCSTSIQGCPEKNHEKYSSNEIYKYPRCIRAYRFGNNTSTSTTSAGNMDLYRGEDEKWKVGFFICIGFLVVLTTVLILIVVCLCKRKKPRDSSRETKASDLKTSSNYVNISPMKLVVTPTLKEFCLRETIRDSSRETKASDLKTSSNYVNISYDRTSVTMRKTDASDTPLTTLSERVSDSSFTESFSGSKTTSNSNGYHLTSSRTSDSSCSPLT